MTVLAFLVVAGLSLGEGDSSATPPSIYPVQQAAAWEHVPGNALSGFYNMYQPCVVELTGDPFPYRMFFFGWAADWANSKFPGCDAIFHARSTDLRKWEVYAGDDRWDDGTQPSTWQPVVCASEKRYDEWHNGDPSVVYKDGRYYMAYSATSKEGFRKVQHAEAYMLCCIMGATSADGIHWTKTAQPLLIESEEAQKCQDVTTHFMDFLRPSLHWEDGRWLMWFDYWHPKVGDQCLGLAANTGAFDAPGGFKPVHDLAKPLMNGWVNCDIVRTGKQYRLFADPRGYGAPPGPGQAWQSRQICEAVSDDGLSWKPVGYIAPKADESADHVPQALVTTVGGKPWLYVFYAVQRGGISDLAGSKQYDFRYDRIRAMRRPLEP